MKTEKISHGRYDFYGSRRLYFYGSRRLRRERRLCKSLRPCLSAAPSACLAHADYIFMAHAETAESADFASRYALAASGMYTLGETPTHASLRCVLREIREICVRQNNQREGNGKRAGWQAQAKRVCLCEFCALCVRQKKISVK